MERSKRQKVSHKVSQFEKLKKLKSEGSKHKYEIEAVENVYEEVSEREYTDTVLKRQEDDWIVNDCGDGYVEDGREIFDDDLDEESINKESKKGKKRERSGVLKNNSGLSKGAGNIQKMLASMPIKKKEVKLEEDDLLGSLMQELDGVSERKATTSNHYSDEIAKREYLKSFSTAPTPKIVKPSINFNSVEKYPKVINEESINETESKHQEEKEVENAKEDMVIDNMFLESSENFCDHIDFEKLDRDTELITKCEINEADEKIDEKPVVSEEDLCKGWRNIVASMDCTEDVSQMDENHITDNKEVFRFYYWDAFEDMYNSPGSVYLFGKVWQDSNKSWVSCCLIVKNIQRRIFLLPREYVYDFNSKCNTESQVSMADVFHEFNKEIAEKYKIMDFKSRSVEKKYAFNIPDVPDDSEYLEVRYSANYKALSSNLEGKTFSKIFGSNASFLELMLLERKIKGPCWLELPQPKVATNHVSWCKMEVICEDMSEIEVKSDIKSCPPLVVLTLALRTWIHPKTHENQIVMISCLVHDEFYADKAAPSVAFKQHFCVLTKPMDIAWPNNYRDISKECKLTEIHIMDSERALLSYLSAKLCQIDADLIVGHDMYAFNIGTLINRMLVNKIAHWSRLGRLKRTNVPTGTRGAKGFVERLIMTGRLVCDIKVSAKELIKARSYDMDTLCAEILNQKETRGQDCIINDIGYMYRNNESLIGLIGLTMEEAGNIAKMMCKLNVIPLSVQITNIAGNVLSRTLLGGRAERNEFLLLHAFYNKDYILPDKVNFKKDIKDDWVDPQDILKEFDGNNKTAGRKKAQYEGGLVLEPKRGFYDKLILLMDFNSLYPSIIQEYNICYTTIPVRSLTDPESHQNLMNQLPLVTQAGILPSEIKKLVESRKQVKRLMENTKISEDLKHQYNIRQLALKLTANSMYGCLGFANSRFCAKPLAALITAKGREILMNTRDLVLKLNYDVIYGDTDSLMINTNAIDYDQVIKIANKIKFEVNKMYKQIELDVDGVFKYMLLLKKKKYAAVSLHKLPDGKLMKKQEVKGLDIVRRDWSQLSAEAGRYVLSQILSEESIDDRIDNIHSRLVKLKEDLEGGKVPLSLLAITKQLTKNPQDYPDKKNLPHVNVALRINKKLSKKMRQGDTISYVICEDGTDLPANQRAYHIDELKNDENLKIDVKYYLSQQIHPVVSRLCEPIEATDPVQIALCLGLDESAYKISTRYNGSSNEGDEPLGTTDSERYKDCDKFQFNCVGCGVINIMECPVTKMDNNELIFTLDRCNNANCNLAPSKHVASLLNKLVITVRSYIHKYYKNWMTCEDSVCSFRTRKLPSRFKGGKPICNACNKSYLIREYTEWKLYNQICYFQYMFDITQALQQHKKMKLPHDSEMYVAYCQLKQYIDRILKYSAYGTLDLGKLWANMHLK